MKTKLFSILLTLLGCCPIEAGSVSSLFNQEDTTRIIVNNRILAKINGKTISTHDVMKKMDILFYKQFPEYTSHVVGRFQFYQVNWKSILDELIDKELILADAAELKIEISGGDVRQELEVMFGPNMIDNLHKIGMSYDEASKIILGELTLRRMIAQRVHSRALRLATPSKARQAYEQYITKPENIRLTKWKYQVVTVRDPNQTKAGTAADAIYKLLVSESIPLNQISDVLQERQLIGRKTKVAVSDEINNDEKEVSESYKEVLVAMDAGMYSQPSLQKSRTDKGSVYRIFYVKEKIPGGVPPYKELETKLQEQVMGDIIDQETDRYLTRLRQHFHVQESDLASMLPQDYQPFVLSR